MDYRNPAFTLRQLQYAVAIAEAGSFGAAAERCGVSQPSMSAQVAKLEDTLDVRLFERHPRGVRTTPAGALLLDRMRAVLREATSLRVTAHTVRDPWALPLRVGVIPTVAPYLLPALTTALRERLPRAKIHWLELQTAICEGRLDAGELDAALIADPPTLPSLEAVELGWEPFFALLPASHPQRDPITVDALLREELMLLEEGHCLRDHALAFCQPARESPFRATSLSTLVQMVAAGLGVSVLPRTAVEVEEARASVRAVPFADPAIGRRLYLLTRRAPRPRSLEPLVATLRSTLAALTRQ